MNKKADADTMNTIKTVVLVLIVLVVLLAIFAFYMKKTGGSFKNQVDCSHNDADKDGVIDIFDKCCKKGGTQSPDLVGMTGCEEGEPASSNCCEK